MYAYLVIYDICMHTFHCDDRGISTVLFQGYYAVVYESSKMYSQVFIIQFVRPPTDTYTSYFKPTIQPGVELHHYLIRIKCASLYKLYN